VVDKIDSWFGLGGGADFVAKLAGTAVNENATWDLAGIATHLRHVRAKLLEVA
jgi:hypothetical protein